MSNYNKIILMGRLTRDVELRHTNNNTAIANFGLAVNHKYKDKEDTMFIDCAAFGRTAEVAAQYLSKGDPVMVDGRLVLDEWQDKKTGDKRSRHKVDVHTLQLMKSDGGGGDERRPAPRSTGKSGSAAGGNDHDSIPF